MYQSTYTLCNCVLLCLTYYLVLEDDINLSVDQNNQSSILNSPSSSSLKTSGSYLYNKFQANKLFNFCFHSHICF